MTLIDWAFGSTTNLTALDGSNNIQTDLSGVTWLTSATTFPGSMETYHPGILLAVRQNRLVTAFGKRVSDDEWEKAGSFTMGSGAGSDIEAIHYVNDDEDFAVLNETDGKYSEVDVDNNITFGPISLTQLPSLMLGDVGGAGPEAVAVVPRTDLAQTLFHYDPQGSSPSGNIVFVGHQQQGLIHGFNLARPDQGYPFTYLGAWRTAYPEVADLSWDRTQGNEGFPPGMLILHGNNYNTIEYTQMEWYTVAGQHKQFVAIFEMKTPWYNQGVNLEGFAYDYENKRAAFAIDTGGANSLFLVDPFDLADLMVGGPHAPFPKFSGIDRVGPGVPIG